MAKRAARAGRSVWERRGLLWVAAFAAVVIAVTLLGSIHVPVAAACTPQAPTNTVLPVITPTGYASYGTPVTSTAGTWTPNCTPMIAPTYQWYRGTTPIPSGQGGTSNLYSTQSGDGSSVITVHVTRCDNTGDDCNEVIGGGSIRHSAAPTPGSVAITGTSQFGHTLTATASGFGLGTPSGTYVYKWYRCTNASDTPGAGTCTTVDRTSSATSSTTDTYTPVATPTPGDIDKYLKVVATVTNTCYSGCGSASATSSAVGPIQGVAPTTGSAEISGTAQSGQTLTATPSGFSLGTPTATYSYQWQYSDSADVDYVNIDGATSSTYVVDPAYDNDYIEVVITATNTCAAGCNSASATSPATGDVIDAVGPTGDTGPTPVFGTACYAQDSTTLVCNVTADPNAVSSAVYHSYAASATSEASTGAQDVTPGTPFTVDLPSAEPDWDVYVSWQDPSCDVDCSNPESDLGGTDAGDIVIDTTGSDFPTPIVGVADYSPLAGTGPSGNNFGPTGGFGVGATGATDSGSAKSNLCAANNGYIGAKRKDKIGWANIIGVKSHIDRYNPALSCTKVYDSAKGKMVWSSAESAAWVGLENSGDKAKIAQIGWIRQPAVFGNLEDYFFYQCSSGCNDPNKSNKAFGAYPLMIGVVPHDKGKVPTGRDEYAVQNHKTGQTSFEIHAKVYIWGVLTWSVNEGVWAGEAALQGDQFPGDTKTPVGFTYMDWYRSSDRTWRSFTPKGGSQGNLLQQSVGHGKVQIGPGVHGLQIWDTQTSSEKPAS
ncbi:MAG TPA: hypothetical protein VGH79_09245 [Gaiellaceae bacterium]|jgi:hypothetical protein